MQSINSNDSSDTFSAEIFSGRGMKESQEVIMKLLLFLFSFFLLFTGCVQEASVPETVPAETSTSPPVQEEVSSGTIPDQPPVEKSAPNARYLPAFEAQTRVGGVVTQTPLAIQVLTEELQSPWGITAKPEGGLLITEKGGTLRIYSPDGTLSPPIKGFPDVDSRGQGGLLDIALSPQFETDHRIYVSFAEKTPEGSLTAVGYGILTDGASEVEDFRTIYRALPYYQGSGHFGSRIVFAEDGTLFVSTGERQADETRMMAQSLDNGYGKIIHIDREGNLLGDYFSTEQNALPGIYSYGHRNVQGMDIHPETGDLWISEMGPMGGDELNLILPGRNYGWPLVSYGLEYDGTPVNEGETQREGTEQPVYFWNPVITPSGMTFYDADKIAEWKNNLFIGGLRGSHIARIVIENRRVVAEERLLEGEGERFRDVAVGVDGALYVITDSGKLYKIAQDDGE